MMISCLNLLTNFCISFKTINPKESPTTNVLPHLSFVAWTSFHLFRLKSYLLQGHFHLLEIFVYILVCSILSQYLQLLMCSVQTDLASSLLSNKFQAKLHNGFCLHFLHLIATIKYKIESKDRVKVITHSLLAWIPQLAVNERATHKESWDSLVVEAGWNIFAWGVIIWELLLFFNFQEVSMSENLRKEDNSPYSRIQKWWVKSEHILFSPRSPNNIGWNVIES